MKMRTILPKVLFSIALVLSSCEREKDPMVENALRYNFMFYNESGMRLYSGDDYPDTVKFRIESIPEGTGSRLKVVFNTISGTTSVATDSSEINPGETAITRWKLGTSSFRQLLRASIFNKSGNFLSSTNLSAYGFRTNEWDSFSESPERSISSIAADTVNDITFMTASGNLYKRGARYFDWEYQSIMGLNGIKSVRIDSNCVFYINSWEGNIFRSADHGQSWNIRARPYNGDNQAFLMVISNDNRIWAFRTDSAAKYSDDGCLTWKRAAKGLESFSGYADIFRLSDGTLLFHGANCCGLLRSVDDGATWTRLETPGLSDKLFVTDDDRIFLLIQSYFYIYMSDDNGASFNPVIRFYPRFWTSYKNNIFTRYRDFYYVLIQGYGIAKSYDLINYQVIYENSDLADLFVDHDGNLIATDLDYMNVYYRKNPGQ